MFFYLFFFVGRLGYRKMTCASFTSLRFAHFFIRRFSCIFFWICALRICFWTFPIYLRELFSPLFLHLACGSCGILRAPWCWTRPLRRILLMLRLSVSGASFMVRLCIGSWPHGMKQREREREREREKWSRKWIKKKMREEEEGKTANIWKIKRWKKERIHLIGHFFSCIFFFPFMLK